MLTGLLFLLGLLLLVLGADRFVRGASDLARRLGVSPLVIGLTVVAFGTSAPELAVSVRSALAGHAELALGNVVGSNILNILLILGLSSLVAPLAVSRQIVRLDVPVMIGAALLPLLLGLNGHLSRGEGAVMFAGIVLYTGFQIFQGSRQRATGGVGDAGGQERGGEESGALPLVKATGWLLLGLAMLVLGSHWLVEGAVALAEWLGLSQLVIGLTVLAAGTSLPEAATSVAASLHGERDIAVGNVVGSNVFNVLAVLGASVAVSSRGLDVPPAALTFDLPVMLAVSVACLPIFFTGYTIARWEGGVFLAYYVAYAIFIVLDATRHEMLPIFTWVMLAFVVPITVLTLVVLAGRELRRQRKERRERDGRDAGARPER